MRTIRKVIAATAAGLMFFCGACVWAQTLDVHPYPLMDAEASPRYIALAGSMLGLIPGEAEAVFSNPAGLRAPQNAEGYGGQLFGIYSTPAVNIEYLERSVFAFTGHYRFNPDWSVALGLGYRQEGLKAHKVGINQWNDPTGLIENGIDLQTQVFEIALAVSYADLSLGYAYHGIFQRIQVYGGVDYGQDPATASTFGFAYDVLSKHEKSWQVVFGGDLTYLLPVYSTASMMKRTMAVGFLMGKRLNLPDAGVLLPDAWELTASPGARLVSDGMDWSDPLRADQLYAGLEGRLLYRERFAVALRAGLRYERHQHLTMDGSIGELLHREIRWGLGLHGMILDNLGLSLDFGHVNPIAVNDVMTSSFFKSQQYLLSLDVDFR